jgi:hypothetical protein
MAAHGAVGTCELFVVGGTRSLAAGESHMSIALGAFEQAREKGMEEGLQWVLKAALLGPSASIDERDYTDPTLARTLEPGDRPQAVGVAISATAVLWWPTVRVD